MALAIFKVSANINISVKNRSRNVKVSLCFIQNKKQILKHVNRVLKLGKPTLLLSAP